jgi:cytoskeletal protein CcmA (bactofilin family)
MFRAKPAIALFALACIALIAPASINAAQFYGGSTLNFSSSDQLKDAYIAGRTISINTPIANDLVVAGGTITIQQNIENGLLAAGGTVTVDGIVGQSARIAGGTIVINGHISRDAIIAGGEVTISKTASIQGDLVIYGGTVIIDGPVTGQVIIKGGTATINATIGSLKDSRIDNLVLGSKAIINGDLNYQSLQEAQIDQGAMIKGQTNYQHSTQHNSQAIQGFSAFSFFYNILAGLIFGLALLFLAHKMTNQSIILFKQSPGITFAWGLSTIFLFPILAILISLLSIYLGIASFIFYILCSIVAVYLAQILLGWWLLNWWFSRTKETYHLDWRSVLVGILVSTVLLLVPVLGWIILAILFVISMGTLAQQVWALRRGA